MVQGRFFKLSILGLCYAFLYIPILYVVVFSFNSTTSLSSWSHFSLVWYEKLFSDVDLQKALMNSLKASTVAATFSVILGCLCAFISTKKKKTFFLDALSATPLVLPEVLLGLSFLIFFVMAESFFGIPEGRGLDTIVIAHTTVSLAYATLIIRARLLEIDTHLEEAALDLGARPVRVFFSITLPFLKPAILVAWFLSFTLSLDDLVVASFAAGPSSATLPISIFSSLKTGITPEINALCSLIVLLVFLIAPIASAWFYLSFRKRVEKKAHFMA